MLNEKQTVAVSKFLSLVLRHDPQAIGIELDKQGWVNVDLLLQQMNSHGRQLTREELDHVVETNTKKRFAYNDSGDKIRASQGHSVMIDLDLQPVIPPAVLYHGTSIHSVDSILIGGLQKGSRQHVHLSADTETATRVGQRHGKPMIFKVQALAMHNAGYYFYISENGVWLTDAVPVDFLTLSNER